MRGPDDWWTVILGTGYRGTLDVLAADERAQVERHVRTAMAAGAADARAGRVRHRAQAHAVSPPEEWRAHRDGVGAHGASVDSVNVSVLE